MQRIAPQICEEEALSILFVRFQAEEELIRAAAKVLSILFVRFANKHCG